MNAQIERPTLKRTPLFSEHEKLAARFTEFGGWNMPLSYSGLSDEHLAVRNAGGLFDVSHMGEIFVSGPKALEFLQFVSTDDLSILENGKAQYGMLLNESGGVVDDIIVYRLSAERYLICVNAGNTEKDWQWLQSQNKIGAKLENESANYSQIAIQGKVAADVLSTVLHRPRTAFVEQAFPAFSCQEFPMPGKTSTLLVARTGYTGEDGFEIFLSPTDAPALWSMLNDALQIAGGKPVGLGARDTLRLEACYPLHGHEISDDITPLEAGLGWAVKLEKGNFIGRDALLKQKSEGLKRKLVGIEVTDRGIVREGTELYSNDGRRVGYVTSGTQTPFLKKSIGLALVDSGVTEIGTALQADVRGKRLAVAVIKKPFYKRSK